MNRVMDCCRPECACKIVLTPRQYENAKERGTTFHCSGGHPQVFRPSDNDELRRKLEVAERALERTRRSLRHEQKTWRCPFGQCYHEGRPKGAMVRHIRAHHMSEAPQLPAEAGPDATNTVVH